MIFADFQFVIFSLDKAYVEKGKHFVILLDSCWFGLIIRFVVALIRLAWIVWIIDVLGTFQVNIFPEPTLKQYRFYYFSFLHVLDDEDDDAYINADDVLSITQVLLYI